MSRLLCLIGLHDWVDHNSELRPGDIRWLLAFWAAITVAIFTFGVGLFWGPNICDAICFAKDRTCLRCKKHVYNYTRYQEDLELRKDRIELATADFEESKEELDL